MTNNYYEKNKEKLRKKAPERYQSLSEEEKDKRPKKDIKIDLKKKKHNKNLSLEQKKKLAEYRKNYYLTHGN